MLFSKKAKKEEKKPALLYPENVKVVVGIAGVGEEHLQILSVIAEQALEEGNMERIINGSEQEVYEILKGGND